MTATRDGGSDQRKAGAVRKPKPKDHGGIGLNNDGALDVVAPGELAAPHRLNVTLKKPMSPQRDGVI